MRHGLREAAIHKRPKAGITGSSIPTTAMVLPAAMAPVFRPQIAAPDGAGLVSSALAART